MAIESVSLASEERTWLSLSTEVEQTPKRQQPPSSVSSLHAHSLPQASSVSSLHAHSLPQERVLVMEFVDGTPLVVDGKPGVPVAQGQFYLRALIYEYGRQVFLQVRRTCKRG